MKSATVLTLLAGFLSLLAIGAIIIIVLKSPSTTDSLTLIGAIIAFLAPLITSVLALIRAEHANGVASKTVAVVQDHIDNDKGTAA